MKIGAIIQARMSSRRLPGKVLLPLGNKPLLRHVMDAIKKVPSVVGIVVATSTETSDDVIVSYCQLNSIAFFRGSLENVAQRFLGTLEKQGWDGAVRISADSPLLDWNLVEEAVTLFASGQWDIVTNIWPRSYPHGQSVEVVGKTVFERAYKLFSKPEEFEHVTGYFYSHADKYRIYNILSFHDQSLSSLAVDTPEDLERIRALMTEHAKA